MSRANWRFCCKFRALLALACIFPALQAGAVHLHGENSGDQFGLSISELEDQNGDGRWELLVGAPENDGTGLSNGRVYLWLGGSELASAADLVISGTVSEKFGYCVARVGDLNNDGGYDFAVGAPHYQPTPKNGRVYIFWGGPLLDGTPDVILEAPDSEAQFGFSVSAAGDLNADGVDDLIVGAPYDDTKGLNAGAAYVYYGGGLGSGDPPDLSLYGREVAGDLFGFSVTDAGRFLGGTLDCVAVGAPRDDTAGTDVGRVYVYRGGSSPPPDAVFDWAAVNSAVARAKGEFGFCVRGLGDWSGDGQDDLAVGAPRSGGEFAQPGRLEIFLGGTGAATTAARTVDGSTAGDHFGWSVADVGDVQGSALVDLVVGAPDYSLTHSGSGRAYLYLGGSPDVDVAGDLYDLPATGVRPGSLPDDHYGMAVSAAGDFDLDGDGDYVVGAPTGNAADGDATGYAHIFDSSGTVTPTLLQDWTAIWDRDGSASLTFTILVPPEEVMGVILTRIPADGGLEELVIEGLPVIAGDGAGGFTWTLHDMGAARLGGACTYTLVVSLAGGVSHSFAALPGPLPVRNPGGPEFGRAHPNPFNPTTTLTFRAPAGTPTTVRILDLRGRQVQALHAGPATGAWQEVRWHGRRDDGRRAASGVYIAELRAENRILTQRLVLTK